MAWIEAHQSLATHRKLYALAGALRVSRATAAGHLLFLWFWAVDNAPDGDLDGIDPHVIKLAADWPKKPQPLIDALVSSGFLDHDRRLHDWEVYAGRLIAQRAKNSQRMRDARATNVQDSSAPHVQGLPTVPTNQPTNQPDQTGAGGARAAAAGEIDPILHRCILALDNMAGALISTPATVERIEAWLTSRPWAYREQPAEWFEKACSDAAAQEPKKHTLAYVEGILRRYGDEGGPGDSRRNGTEPTDGISPELRRKLDAAQAQHEREAAAK